MMNNKLTLIALCVGLQTLQAFGSDLVTNGDFVTEAGGALPGWTLLKETTKVDPPPSEVPGIGTQTLYILDNGGVTQMLRGLKEDQTYRLTFRALRRGGDWAPYPTLKIGKIPIPMTSRELSPAPNTASGSKDEFFTIDQLVRPGDGDFPLTIEVSGDIAGMENYVQVWVESVSLQPVSETIDLLEWPLETTAFWDQAVLRSDRIETVGLQLQNLTEASAVATVRLKVPEEVEIIGEAEQTVSEWTRRSIYCWFITAYEVPRMVPEKVPASTLTWKVKARQPGEYRLQIEVNGERLASSTIPIFGTFEPPLPPSIEQGKVPPPKPADTGDIQVGVNFYPGWVPGTGWGWSVLDPFPLRKPALGYYDDSNPEVVDWQIKWALEHGISFFNICWFRLRGNEGKPVESWRADTLDNGFLKSRFGKQIDFALTWENQNAAGVTSAQDTLDNLLPYWIEHFFRRENYLTFDGKPVLFIYSVNNFIAQIGGSEKLPPLLDEMRERCRQAGLSGLIVVGEYRESDPAVVEALKAAGVDATWSYGMEDVEGLRLRKKWDLLPDIATISVGWDPRPWQDYMGYWWTQHWNRTPEEFEKVAQETKKIVESYPTKSIGRHVVLLDNWNEWGEGHWIAPSRHQGFGYLEAIRRVFAPGSPKPTSILPADVGLGPYDGPYEHWIESQKAALEK